MAVAREATTMCKQQLIAWSATKRLPYNGKKKKKNKKEAVVALANCHVPCCYPTLNWASTGSIHTLPKPPDNAYQNYSEISPVASAGRSGTSAYTTFPTDFHLLASQDYSGEWNVRGRLLNFGLYELLISRPSRCFHRHDLWQRFPGRLQRTCRV